MLQNMADLLDQLNERLRQPSSRGLAYAVGAAIADGVLVPGEKLPPIRMVAARLQLSPTTVSASWALLARSGTIRTDGRRGSTVADTRPAGSRRYRRALPTPAEFALDLSTGVPDPALLPSLHRAIRAVPAAASMSSYLDDPVIAELVEVLRADWPYPAEEFLIVDGAMDALDLTARATLRFGDRVVVEHPTFPPLLDLLEAMGADVIGVAVDDEGIIPAELQSALSAPVAAVFLQPRGQNPTGVTLSALRIAALAELLRDTGTLVVEDDSSGAIAAAPPISLGSVLPQQTLHVRSFSKSHGPDLRLAAVSGPDSVLARLADLRQLGQGWTSRLLQRILLELLTDSRSVAQVEAARSEYSRRRRALVAALAANDIAVGGNDGLNVWVPVQDESAAIVRLASQGIGVAPGAPFGVRSDRTGYVRVTAGLLSRGQDETAAQLAAAARTAGWSAVR
jgi:DNA-binding transcriptional MocR family regulator